MCNAHEFGLDGIVWMKLITTVRGSTNAQPGVRLAATMPALPRVAYSNSEEKSPRCIQCYTLRGKPIEHKHGSITILFSNRNLNTY